jgi:hypothetical protein
VKAEWLWSHTCVIVITQVCTLKECDGDVDESDGMDRLEYLSKKGF